ncbi:hypothetical protein WKW79_25275 [Variovorax robiniae]|uniref:Uncharacterized protein n=1 Tax=Variovorax robiniae TaxID=1836199 RepID=A0ABU8XDK2_9BURK
MSTAQKVLLIGFDPSVVDYSKWPGLTPEKLYAAFDADLASFTQAGFEAQYCLVDLGATAEESVRKTLAAQQFDVVLIGAGVRTSVDHFLLFEKLVNVVHRHAGSARICFNTGPTDSVAAVRRWV